MAQLTDNLVLHNIISSIFIIIIVIIINMIVYDYLKSCLLELSPKVPPSQENNSKVRGVNSWRQRHIVAA